MPKNYPLSFSCTLGHKVIPFYNNKLVWHDHYKTFFYINELQFNISLKKIEKSVWESPTSWDTCTTYKLQKLTFKKQQVILYHQNIIINVTKKSIYCLPDNFLRRSKWHFLSKFFVQNESIRWILFKLSQTVVLAFHILAHSFWTHQC